MYHGKFRWQKSGGKGGGGGGGGGGGDFEGGMSTGDYGNPHPFS